MSEWLVCVSRLDLAVGYGIRSAVSHDITDAWCPKTDGTLTASNDRF
jgi:hypothetical protein